MSKDDDHRTQGQKILDEVMSADYSDPAQKLIRSKAIRWKCIDCMCGQMDEVRKCDVHTCTLWPYRMGGAYPPEWQTGPHGLERRPDGAPAPTGGDDSEDADTGDTEG